MKKFKAAVIGCGRAGSFFDIEDKRKVISSHCGAYKECPETDLISICDKDKRKLDDSSKYWGVNKTYLSYEDLLNSERIDILSVCTLPEDHLKVIQFAADEGVKAIYCEKPITKSLSEAKEVIKICKENNILLTINHQRRWNSQFIDLKNKIEKKEFGEIQHINFYYTRGVYNSGSHLFDLMRMLFGEVDRVLSTSSLVDFQGEPTINAILNFNNKFSANLIGLNGNNYRIFDLEVFFTKGRLTLDASLNMSFSEPEESSRTSEFLELSSPKNIESIKEDDSPMTKAVHEIAVTLDGGGLLSCTGEDGYKSLEIIHSLIESLKKKKEITLPLRL